MDDEAETAGRRPERRPALPTPHDGEQAEPERGGAAGPGEEPDVLLDVPALHVDTIDLEVEDLRARVNLQAEVLDLLRLNVGVDVALRGVRLDVEGVDAKALLKARLHNVATIIARVLSTIDHNPQIIENISSSVGSTVQDVAGRASRPAGALGPAVGEAGDAAVEATRDAGEAVPDSARAGAGDRDEAGGDVAPAPDRVPEEDGAQDAADEAADGDEESADAVGRTDGSPGGPDATGWHPKERSGTGGRRTGGASGARRAPARGTAVPPRPSPRARGKGGPSRAGRRHDS